MCERVNLDSAQQVALLEPVVHVTHSALEPRFEIELYQERRDFRKESFSIPNVAEKYVRRFTGLVQARDGGNRAAPENTHGVQQHPVKSREPLTSGVVFP